MSMNSVSIGGNLTNDPTLRATAGGTQVLSFGVAVNDRRKDPSTGQWQDYPNYVDCVVFGNRAEPLSRILTKGMHIAAHGKLRWSSWEDKTTGGRRSKLEVVVDEVELLSQRQQQDQPYAAQPSPQMAPAGPQMPQYAPQAQQGYQSANMPRQAPQMGSQAPAAPQPPYQQQMAMPQAPTNDIYSEDIPF